VKKILIGTNNPSKFQVFVDYLAGLDVCCVSPADIGLCEIPPETERSAAGNALQKAKAWHRLSGLPVITEDSGLVFVDLPEDHPDQPGVMVRRASGHAMDDDEMLQWYSQVIQRHGGELRAAWEDAWCILKDDKTFSLHTDLPETLAKHAKQMVSTPCEARLPGWPLDSLTFDPLTGKYKAEMRLEEMHAMTDGISIEARLERQQLVDWMRQTVQEMLKE